MALKMSKRQLFYWENLTKSYNYFTSFPIAIFCIKIHSATYIVLWIERKVSVVTELAIARSMSNGIRNRREFCLNAHFKGPRILNDSRNNS